MTKRESAIERYLTQRAKALGGIAVKLNTRVGIPDRLVLLPKGRAIFVELKAYRGIVSDAQHSWHEFLQARDFEVHVIRDTETIDKILPEVDKCITAK